MNKAKKILTNTRILTTLIITLLAIIAIYPNPNAKGVAIRSVERNSSANLAGIENPSQTAPPMARERVLYINDIEIKDIGDYYDIVSKFEPETTVAIKTNKKRYTLKTKAVKETIVLNETIEKNITEVVETNVTVNGTVKKINKTVNKTILVNKTKIKVIGTEDIGLSVYNAPTTNIRKGLDLQGGTRVLLQPEEKLDKENMEILIESMKERLNVYGLTDVVVRESRDLSGNQYILVEIAGAEEKEARELLAKQGKFEAKIGNSTVFKGGNDITYVCRTAECSGLDPRQGCGESGEQYFCRFMFSISLSPEAAKKHAELTKDLDIITEENSKGYLSEKLYLYLDNQLVDSLNIGAELKGKPETDIAISLSGIGATKKDAILDGQKNMKKLQTVLITGSLPVKLNIVKTDSISPFLGEKFVKNAILVSIVAILAVAFVIFISFRRIEIALPMLFTMLLEVVLLLGVAAFIGWNIDLAAIAGIIVAVGTGVDDQIVIADETLKGQYKVYSWKEKLKRAFFIIFAAYFTTVVAMIPLLFAGAGLIKGFAITTILGVSIGVFISRPAFATVVEILLKE